MPSPFIRYVNCYSTGNNEGGVCIFLALQTHRRLQYDCLYKEDSSHTDEISTPVACNAACVQEKRSCKRESEICVVQRNQTWVWVCVCVCHH